MKYKISAKTQIGRRSVNQDNFMIDRQVPFVEFDGEKTAYIDDDKMVHAVAVVDGVGSSSDGQLASITALEVVGQILQKKPLDKSLREIAEEIIDEVNSQINIMNRDFHIHMATTLSLFIWRESEYVICNIGDSPVFKVTDSKVSRMNLLHTEAERKKRIGEKPLRGDEDMLICYCGMKNVKGSHIAFIREGKWRGNEAFILCTDGASKELKVSSILNAFQQECINKMDCIWGKLPADTGDNATVLILEKIDNKYE